MVDGRAAICGVGELFIEINKPNPWLLSRLSTFKILLYTCMHGCFWEP